MSRGDVIGGSSSPSGHGVSPPVDIVFLPPPYRDFDLPPPYCEVNKNEAFQPDEDLERVVVVNESRVSASNIIYRPTSSMSTVPTSVAEDYGTPV